MSYANRNCLLLVRPFLHSSQASDGKELRKDRYTEEVVPVEHHDNDEVGCIDSTIETATISLRMRSRILQLRTSAAVPFFPVAHWKLTKLRNQLTRFDKLINSAVDYQRQIMIIFKQKE